MSFQKNLPRSDIVMSPEDKKKLVAEAALEYLGDEGVIGVGSGSTVGYFIAALANIKHRFEAAVASSEMTENLLKRHHIPIVPLNSVNHLPVYVDGADEATHNKQLIKGGGGALVREKVIAAVSKKFICIIDDSKLVGGLGHFPLPIEVIPMASSYVAREMVKLGGQPILREKFISDNGNVILDVHNLKIMQASELEKTINHIPGVVCNGLFVQRPADILLIADGKTVKLI